jgi:hypothetical protein
LRVSAVQTTACVQKGLSVVQPTQEAMPPEESPAAATTTTASSLKRPPKDSSSPANTKNHKTMDVSTPNDLPRQVVCQHAYADRSRAATRQEQDGNSHQRVNSVASDAFSLNLSREGTSPFEASPNDSLGTPFPYFAGQSVDGRGLAHGMATFGTPYRSICDNKQANQESSAVASQMQQGSIGDTPNQESSFKTPQKNESFKNIEKTVRFLEEMKPCNILSSTKKSKSDLISTPVKGSEIARNFEINYEKEPPPICNEIDFKVIDDLGIGLMKDYVVDESSPFAFQQEFATSVHGYIALKQVAYDPGIEHRVLVHNNKDHHHYSTIMKKTSFISGVTKSQIVNEQKEVWVEEGDLLCIKAYECPSFGVVTQKKSKPKPDDPVETVCCYLVPTDFLIAYLQSKEMGKWKAVFT